MRFRFPISKDVSVSFRVRMDWSKWNCKYFLVKQDEYMKDKTNLCLEWLFSKEPRFILLEAGQKKKSIVQNTNFFTVWFIRKWYQMQLEGKYSKVHITCLPTKQRNSSTFFPIWQILEKCRTKIQEFIVCMRGNGWARQLIIQWKDAPLKRS